MMAVELENLARKMSHFNHALVSLLSGFYICFCDLDCGERGVEYNGPVEYAQSLNLE